MSIQTASATLYFILFAMVIVLPVVSILVSQMLIQRLERVHPKSYEAMGRPSLLRRSSISGSCAYFKFLAAREHKELHDTYLSKVSDAMLVLFAIYVLVFFGLIFLAAGETPTA